MNNDIYHLLMALAIGAIIGAEREYRSKSAGLRTMIMIGVENPDRLAANILTGLGFLGAGVIFKDDNRISGITTATTIWMVAALGMAAGAGYEYLAFIGTILVLIVLIFLVYFQDKIEAIHQSRNYRILCDYQQETLDKYEELFKQYNMKVLRGVQNKTEKQIIGRWVVIGSAQNHKKLTHYLLLDPNIKELSF
ncbi:hypothetical protein FQR65_LT16141 [Abscondita terminalis]|nr:hypothetical protein FQR65_LT16141 [Abscondita terminalis]